ncbi:GTP cyclohydrolase II [Nocardia mangyaensis]|uniref:GTP cyclohydrolase II n=1 Tax=Nocardia mangyaensis TaxID=2213200 RepID=UPI0026774A98|nr:GTP cyclohydrolase II [Nocardia mangyaensis]MDO3646363.1 GTP cyclohydrolase II [Nocardia mangyaensis]
MTIIESVQVTPGTAAGRGADDLRPEHMFSRNGEQIRVQVHTIDDPTDGGYVLVFGEPGPQPLVRVHSRCLYGDALGSDDCDCGPELARSMDLIQAEGAGVLVYLEQEGRGAGLIWKAIGYRTSERFDLDTFDSYERLGLEPDTRRYEVVAKTLLDLGLHQVRLLTNNPDKVRALTEQGIAVEVIPLAIRLDTERGRRYLDAKVRRRKHMIPGDFAPWAPLYTPAPAAQAPPTAPDRPWWRRWPRFGGQG